MSEITKKAPLSRNWWRKLVNTLMWNKNAGLPLSEKYWQNLNDRIMSQIENKKTFEKYVEKYIDKKTGQTQVSVEI